MASKTKKAPAPRLTLAEIRCIGRGGLPKDRNFLHAGHTVEILVRDLLEARKKITAFEWAERQKRTLESLHPLNNEKRKLARMVGAFQFCTNGSPNDFVTFEEGVNGGPYERRAAHYVLLRQMALVLALMPNS